jgi:hypothetical protein
MSVTFKWSITKVCVAQQNEKLNVVIKAEWFLTGTDGELTASASGYRDFTLGDSFTNFDQLTEQQVLDWCFAPEEITLVDREGAVTTFTKLLKDESEAQVAEQIARQLAKKTSEPALPWVEIPA